MFEKDPKHLAFTLTEMDRMAREKTCFDRIAAKGKMAEYLAQDRRFDGYDAQRLIDRVQHCRGSGAVLDLDDPALLKGGRPRPLDRSRY